MHDDLAAALVSLGEAQRWCSTWWLGMPREFLRTPALRPFPAGTLLLDHWDNIDRYVLEVIAQRSQLLRLSPERVAAPGGALLHYDFTSITSGESEFESDGLFTIEDVPPWDTWVWRGTDGLLAWIPQSHVDAAERGIRSNPYECIQWAAHEGVALVRQLEAAGIDPGRPFPPNHT